MAVSQAPPPTPRPPRGHAPKPQASGRPPPCLGPVRRVSPRRTSPGWGTPGRRRPCQPGRSRYRDTLRGDTKGVSTTVPEVGLLSAAAPSAPPPSPGGGGGGSTKAGPSASAMAGPAAGRRERTRLDEASAPNQVPETHFRSCVCEKGPPSPGTLFGTGRSLRE